MGRLTGSDAKKLYELYDSIYEKKVEHSEHVEHDGEVVAEDAEEVEEGAANIIRAGLAAGTALAGGMVAKKAADVAGKIKEKQQKKADMIKKTLGNSHELEGEDLQEYGLQGAVKGALDKGAKFMKTNPVGKAVGAVLKPAGGGTHRTGNLNLPKERGAHRTGNLNLRNGVDMFDLIKGHLIDEGYAETEEAALAMMANMTEEWRNNIIESITAE